MYIINVETFRQRELIESSGNTVACVRTHIQICCG